MRWRSFLLPILQHDGLDLSELVGFHQCGNEWRRVVDVRITGDQDYRCEPVYGQMFESGVHLAATMKNPSCFRLRISKEVGSRLLESLVQIDGDLEIG